MNALVRNRWAIVGGILLVYLTIGAWQFETAPFRPNEWAVEVVIFGRLLPPFAALMVAVSGAILAFAPRRGEPLDGRPRHAAMTGVALLWITVFELAIDKPWMALASGVAGIAFLVAAFAHWTKLFRLLGSRKMVERTDVAAPVPPVVEGIAAPVVLFTPTVEGYREDAKGWPVAAVPLDRSIARRKLVGQVVIAAACAFLALPGAAFAAAPSLEAVVSRYTPEHSTWRGEVDIGARRGAFTLDLEQSPDGTLTGVMDWGSLQAEVEGTYEGDRLVFFDRSSGRADGAPFNLDDRKVVRIVGGKMIGTDKDGRVSLHAVRVR